MKNRTDGLKQLLFELNKICDEHNLKYILTGNVAKKIKDNDRFPERISNISIAMTMGDIERLIQIVNNRDDDKRQVEYILNNRYATNLQVRYCNNETTLVDIRNYIYHENHGLYVKIIPISKISKSRKEKKKLSFLKKIYKVSGKELGVYKVSRRFVALLIKGVVSLIGRKRVAQALYNLNKSVEYIDKWEDISNYDKVRIGKAVFGDETDWCIEEIGVEGTNIKIVESVNSRIIERTATINYIERNVIWQPNIPFKEYFADREIADSLKKVLQLRTNYTRSIRSSRKPQAYIKESWDKYLMTRDIVSIRKYYSEHILKDVKTSIMQNDEANYKDKMQMYLTNKRKWERKGFPFLEILNMPELEELKADWLKQFEETL